MTQGFYSNTFQAALTQEQIQAMINVVTECARKEGATQNDMEDIIAHRLPTTKVVNCLHTCILEQFGWGRHKIMN